MKYDNLVKFVKIKDGNIQNQHKTKNSTGIIKMD